MIEIDHLFKGYQAPDGKHVQVLRDISLTVPAGSITAVVGPSGAGNSTLAKCISLLEKPSRGSIRVNGQDLSQLSGEILRRERRAIGTVFQSSALLRRKTARENIALPLEYLGVVPRDITKRVDELLANVGLADKAGYYPAQLSGGQRQRVGIARALALQPQVLLADEATSGLDPESTAAILALLKQLRDDFGLSIILITHEMDAVRNAADAVAEIRNGSIIQQGLVRELLAAPDSLLGQQLFPLNAWPATGEGLLFQVTYAAYQPVEPDWISRISRQLGVEIDLLGGHVERVGDRLAGRLQVAMRFNGAAHATDDIISRLHRLGVNAEPIGEPMPDRRALREAV